MVFLVGSLLILLILLVLLRDSFFGGTEKKRQGREVSAKGVFSRSCIGLCGMNGWEYTCA
jgi:hypothetical protein